MSILVLAVIFLTMRLKWRMVYILELIALLGKQCIVGAGAVVTSNAGDYEVLVGNPAKVIRKLNEIKETKAEQ